MMTTILSRLHLEPINAHCFDLAVVRSEYWARPQALDGDGSGGMSSRDCRADMLAGGRVCH